MGLGVIVPTLDNWEGLEQFKASIVTSLPYRLVVVPTAAEKQVNGKQISVAAAWNKGCTELFKEYEVVAVCNDDILLPPYAFDVLYAVLFAANPEVGTLSPSNMREEPEKWERAKDKNMTEYYVFSAFRRLIEHLSPYPDFSCFLLKRECWEEVGTFDENFWPAYCEDNDFHCRMVFSGWTAASCELPYLHIGGGTQNKQGTDNPKCTGTMFEENRRYFVSKWGSLSVNEPSIMQRMYYKTPYNNPNYTIKDWVKGE